MMAASRNMQWVDLSLALCWQRAILVERGLGRGHHCLARYFLQNGLLIQRFIGNLMSLAHE